MATNTPNINLVKPDYTDNADIGVVNANSDKIDAAVKALQDLIAALQTSTTPQAILNAIKTVDGIGSGLDADLLDGKDSSYFHPTLVAVENDNANNFKTSGKFFFTTNVLNLPESFSNYCFCDVIGNGGECFQTLYPAFGENHIFIRSFIYNTNIWSSWREIGGGNLFTYPKTFNVINAQAGQTVFSYSGGAGRVITTHMANTSPEITIDGSVVTYANYPYSGTGATGTSQVINLEFKNSVIIKTVQAATGNVTGLIQTENP